LIQSHDHLIATSLNTEPTVSKVKSDEALTHNNPLFNPNYEIMYKNLIIKYEIIKSENENLKTELLLLKKSNLDHKNFNGNLRHTIKKLQKRLKILKSILTHTQ
jgi:hypothetical protein